MKLFGVDKLAQIIRFRDGSNELGAGALAEAILDDIHAMIDGVQKEVEGGHKAELQAMEKRAVQAELRERTLLDSNAQDRDLQHRLNTLIWQNRMAELKWQQEINDWMSKMAVESMKATRAINAMHSAIAAPKGVVPAEAEDLYEPNHPALGRSKGE